MLTKRQNLLETIRGGNPDRFVNQFEPFAMIWQTPVTVNNPRPVKGGPASTYPGVYGAVTETINMINQELSK